MGPVRRCPPLWPTCWCRADAVSDAAPRGQCRTPCLGSATVSDSPRRCRTGWRTRVRQVHQRVRTPVGSCPDLRSHFSRLVADSPEVSSWLRSSRCRTRGARTDGDRRAGVRHSGRRVGVGHPFLRAVSDTLSRFGDRVGHQPSIDPKRQPGCPTARRCRTPWRTRVRQVHQRVRAPCRVLP